MKKTLKQEAAESLRRKAGQYERHEKYGKAAILRDSADRFLGKEIKNDSHTWDVEEG